MKKYIVDNKEVSQTMYLYGTEDVPEIPQEVIDERITLLEINLARLLDHSFYTRDAARANAVLKAIKFWQNIEKDLE
jgi:hypothetical protein